MNQAMHTRVRKTAEIELLWKETLRQKWQELKRPQAQMRLREAAFGAAMGVFLVLMLVGGMALASVTWGSISDTGAGFYPPVAQQAWQAEAGENS